MPILPLMGLTSSAIPKVIPKTFLNFFPCQWENAYVVAGWFHVVRWLKET